MATENDRKILNCVFNQLSPFGESDCECDAENEDRGGEEEEDCDLQLSLLEREGVRLAESGHLSQAIDLFTQAILLAPSKPSAYNNRAQAFRLKGDIPAALRDLDTCLETSGGRRGKAYVQALCQRGLVHQLEGRTQQAYRDLQMAANMGSRFAKSMLPKLNPYSALCNQMLREVIDKLKHE